MSKKPKALPVYNPQHSSRYLSHPGVQQLIDHRSRVHELFTRGGGKIPRFTREARFSYEGVSLCYELLDPRGKVIAKNLYTPVVIYPEEIEFILRSGRTRARSNRLDTFVQRLAPSDRTELIAFLEQYKPAEIVTALQKSL